MSQSLLLIDDDTELTELLSDYLGAEGFEMDQANDGASGLEKALSGRYALIVLDVMLPQLNGFEVLRKLREKRTTPVLMLTAKGDDIDRIVGLELGADDYLSKPFNPRELTARIRAVLRRTEKQAVVQTEVDTVVVGDLELMPSALTCRLRGQLISLTTAEFQFLLVLARAAGQVVSRDDLSEKVLGRELSPYDRSLDVHVSNLRKKIGTNSDGSERIKTVRGTGYLYAYEGTGA